MNPSFSVLSHFDRFKELSQQPFDLIVVGGGITGAGIALDAANRGLKVVLFEKGDFASGTSSRSTKLIHGGLRYLKQLEIGLVREVGLERSIVHRMAPHMVIPEKMLLPLVEDGTFGKWATSLGLWVYDVLAGVDGDDQRVMLDDVQTLEKEPLLNPEKLVGGGFYAEYRTDDARLTIENLKRAVSLGAVAFNHANVGDFIYQQSKVVGVKVKSEISGDEAEFRASYIINATGPWVDQLRKNDNSLKGKSLHLTKGVHIVVPHGRLPLRQAVYFDVPDGRMIFAIPRGKVTYIGTTDTDYKGNLEAVYSEKKDADYLLKAANNTFPTVCLTAGDIQSTWAGLRPLIHEEGKSASELSRKDEIFESESGLLSIAGGKLTGYRKMAEKIVDKVMEKMQENEDREFVDCTTDRLKLPGGDFENYSDVAVYKSEIADRVREMGGSEFDAWYLVSTYGRQTDEILQLAKDGEGDFEYKLISAELQFTFEYEMACTPLDFIVQRTGKLYFDIESARKNLDQIVQFYAARFGWPEQRISKEKLLVAETLQKATSCIAID